MLHVSCLIACLIKLEGESASRGEKNRSSQLISKTICLLSGESFFMESEPQLLNRIFIYVYRQYGKLIKRRPG